MIIDEFFKRANSQATLELLCADDFGASYKPEDQRTQYDIESIRNYEETREKHRMVEELVQQAGIQSYIADSDDRDSRHSDAYLYFPLSQVDIVAQILDQIGLPGDILDVPPDTAPELVKEIQNKYLWQINA